MTTTAPNQLQRDSLWGWSGTYNPGEAMNAWQLGSIYAGLPGLASALHGVSNLSPQYQSNLAGILKMFSPGNQQALGDAYQNRAVGAAQDQARTFGNQAGLASGLVQGMQRDAVNNAVHQSNDYRAQIQSPEYQQQVAGLMQNVMNGALNPGLIQALMALSNNHLGIEQMQGQQDANGGLGGMFGSILGAAAPGIGSWVGKMFK